MSLKVTGLEELKLIAEKVTGDVIEIQGFTDNSVINVKVKALSLLELVQADILPNPLLIAVNSVIIRQTKGELLNEKEAKIATKQMEKFTEIVYKQALVEPTVDEFKSVGLELNKMQKRMIAEYAIGDLSTYNRFRKFRENLKSNPAIEELQQIAKRDNGDK